MEVLAITFLVVAVVVNLLFGLTVLLRTYQRAYGWYFGITIMALVLWAAGDAGLLFSNNSQDVYWFARLFYIAPLFIPVFIWFFALTFPENRPLPKMSVAVAVVSLAVFSVMFLWKLDFFVHGIEISSPYNMVTPRIPGFLIYAAYFSLFFLLTYITFIKKMRRLKGVRRTQIAYTFWGALVASAPALFTNLALPVMGVNDLIWLGPFLTLAFAGAVTAAIIRHRLFNIRLVLARSVGYMLSLASLAILYGVVAFTFITNITFVSEAQLGWSQKLVYALLAAALAFTFPPLRRFFEKATNRLFYRDAYDPQSLIGHLNRSLVSNTNLDHMLDDAASTLQSYIKSDFCVFVVHANEGYKVVGTPGGQLLEIDAESIEQFSFGKRPRVVRVEDDDHETSNEKLNAILNRSGIAVFGRLSAEGKSSSKPLGFLLLGGKKSGNSYTDSDIRVLEIIVNELVIAIENALRFQEIENFNKTLQEKIDSATRELKRKNERLRILDQTKDDFISMASHQLRTPLTSVKGYISMVLDGDAGKTNELQRKLLTQSFVSAQRMVYLISDLLNVSRLRTGKFVIEPMESNLARVIEEEVEQLSETAKSHGLTLVYNKPQNFPELMLDETKLRQVIMNFIDNAIYYTPHGGRIEVSLVEKPQSVEFTVVDNGIGVPKHEQHRLFTKFFRAHNAKNVRPDGTGLGIFMAKKVIVAQGGAIIFKSTEGKGSTFGFTFPKARLLPKPKPTDNPPAASKPATKISIKSDSDSRAKPTAKSA